MDDLALKMTSFRWIYADKDPAALAELEARIAAAGRELKLITYSDLARGDCFSPPSNSQRSAIRDPDI